MPGALSNGCENSPGSSAGYRTQFPLHVQYRGTQMQYALKYLAVHRHTRLVTINIGANDMFLCQETTADHCASAAEVHAALQEIQANLTTIYTKIRDVARHHGLLVVLTYYSLNYSDPAQVAGAEALNSAIASVTEKFGGKVADGFAAFEGPSAAFGGSPCAAGLLTFFARPSPTCSSHGATLARPIAPTEDEACRCELGRERNSFGAQITAGRGADGQVSAEATLVPSFGRKVDHEP